MSELPQGWVEATVSDLAGSKGLVTDGDWIESKDQDPDGEVRLIQLADIGDGDFRDRSSRFVTTETAARLRCTRLEGGDLLIARMPDPLGRACIFPGLDQPAITAVDVFIWRGQEDGPDARWLMYTINSPAIRDSIAGQAGGTTRQRIAGGRLKQLSVPVPPLPEQRRIVAKIDSLTGKSTRARDHLDHIPRLVEKYKQAVLAAAFRGDLTREWRETNDVPYDYEPVKVAQLAKVITGSTPPTKNKDEFFGGDIPFVKPTDLDAGYDVRAVRETLTEAGAAVSRPVPSGSTLVTCIGATIAKTGFARVACCTNQQINSLVPDRKKIVPEWLYWMVVSPDFRQSILDNSSATTLPIINKGRFQELVLPSAPMSEQREIVHRLESAFQLIDRIASEATSARRLIDRLDQAVLAKAFRGELVPQDPEDEPASMLLERIRAERSAAPKAKRGRRAKT